MSERHNELGTRPTEPLSKLRHVEPLQSSRIQSERQAHQ